MNISPPEKQSSQKVTTLSPQEQEHLTQVINEILTKYDGQADKQSVEEFTTQFVQQREISTDTSELLSSINRGFGTIDQINGYHQDLINAQSGGQSKVNWLKTMIKTATNIKDVRKIGKIVQEVQTALAESNNHYLASLLDENIGDVEIFTPMPERDFEEINEAIIVQDLLSEVQTNSLLNVISTAQTVESLTKKINDVDGNVIEVAKQCFEGEMGNNEETLVKKLATAGVMIADAEMPIQALDGVNASEVAMIVDMGITLSKVGYKVSQGKMAVGKAIEYIADRAIADTAVVVSTIAKLKIEYVAAGMGTAVGTVFGPVGMAIGAFVGHGVGKVTGAYIAPKIEQGIKKVAQVAKPMVRQVVQKTVEVAKQAGKTITEGAKKVGKAIANFFGW